MINSLVSIVIPTFNAEERISQTLSYALKQTYKNIEILVVDDGSTDQTTSIAKQFLEFSGVNFKLFTLSNGGPSRARNFGWRHACGEWIQFLDDDDLISSIKIESQNRVADKVNTDIAFIASRWSERRDKALGGDVIHEVISNPSLADIIRSDGFTPFGAGLVKREWLKNVGGFNEKLRNIEDVDLQIRLLAAGAKFVKTDTEDPLFIYVHREGSLSKKNKQEFLDGCIRNAELALKLAVSNKKLLQDVRGPVCDVLCQGVVFYAESDLKMMHMLISRIRSIDGRYIRKNRMIQVTATIAGWGTAEVIAAKWRKFNRYLTRWLGSSPIKSVVFKLH